MSRAAIEQEKARIRYEDASDAERERIRALIRHGNSLITAVKAVLK